MVGVFGLLTGPVDEEASTPPAHLTPRQAEVLRLLEQGRLTKQIAQELHLEHGDGQKPRPPSAVSASDGTRVSRPSPPLDTAEPEARAK